MAESAKSHLEQLDECLSRFLAALETALESSGATTAPSAEPTSADSTEPLALIRRALRLQALLKADAEKIKEHQNFQARIAHVRDLIAEQNSARVDIVMSLHSAKVTLETALRKAKACQVQKAGREGRRLSAMEILNYASKLAKYTSAPPKYDPTAAEQFMETELPFPSELAMRSTLMNQPNMGLAVSEEPERAAEARPAAAPAFRHASPIRHHIQPPSKASSGGIVTDGSEDEAANPWFDLDLNPDLE